MTENTPEIEHRMTEVDYIIMGINPSLATKYEEKIGNIISKEIKIDGAEMDAISAEPETSLKRHPLFDVTVYTVE